MSFRSRLAMRWLPAFLLVGAQVVFLPVASYVFGDARSASLFVLVSVFSALAVGESGRFGRAFAARSGALLGACLVLFGATFETSLRLVWSVPGLSWLLAAALLLTMVQVGKNVVDGVYFSTQAASEPVGGGTLSGNYSWINLLAVVSVVVWVWVEKALGLRVGLVALGLHLVLSSLLIRRQRPVAVPALRVDAESLYSVAIGILSSGYISILFSVMDLVIVPGGYEFPLYLIGVFLAMGVAAPAMGPVTRRAGRGASAWLVTLGGVSAALLLALLFGGPDAHGFFVDPLGDLAPLDWLFGQQHVYWHYAVFLIGLWMLPYLFYAGLVPARSYESPEHNHLFLVSVGNTLGLVAFGWLARNADLGGQLTALVGGTAAVVALRLRPLWRERPVATATLGLLLATGLSAPRIDDARIGIQGRRLNELAGMRQTTREQEALRPRRTTLDDLVILTRRDGGVGYLTDRGGLDQTLTLGSYDAQLHLTHDLVKSIVLRDLITPETRRVLILGLGNHQNLRDAVARFEQLGVEDYRIDVVDSYGPFAAPEFREVIAAANGFEWRADPRVVLHIADAMPFLVGGQQAPYDVIMWNLTRAFYSAARKLYTAEYARAISASLTEGGVFAMLKSYGLIDCTMAGAFAYSERVGASRRYRSGVGLYSNAPLERFRGLGTAPGGDCDGQAPLTLSRPFSHASRWGIRPRAWLGEAPLVLREELAPSAAREHPPRRFASDSARLGAALNGRGRALFASLPLTGARAAQGRALEQALDLFVERSPRSREVYALVLDSGSDGRLALVQTLQMMRAGVAHTWLLPGEPLPAGGVEALAQRARRLGQGGWGVAPQPVPAGTYPALPLRGVAEPLAEPLVGAIRALAGSGFERATLSVSEALPHAAAIAAELRAVAERLGAREDVGGPGGGAPGLALVAAPDLARVPPDRGAFRVLLLEDTAFLEQPPARWPRLRDTLLVLPWLAGLDYGPGSGSCEFAAAHRERFGHPPGAAAARLYAGLELMLARGGVTGDVQPLPASVTGAMRWAADGRRETDHVAFLHFDGEGAATLYLPGSVAGACPFAAERLAGLPISARRW